MVIKNFKMPKNTKQTVPTLFHANRGILLLLPAKKNSEKNSEVEYEILTKLNKTQTKYIASCY